MKKLFFLFAIFAIIFSCTNNEEITTNSNEQELLQERHYYNKKTDYFAVANRGDGTVSIYNADKRIKKNTLTMPDENAAPTYVVYSRYRDLLYVADFNNKKVIVFEAENFSKINEFSTGSGSFHMWLNDYAGQLWVNNIVDKTTSVIDLNNGNTLVTLTLPQNLNLPSDAAQHDVILSPFGYFAYVSVFSKTGQNYVLQYNTFNFKLKKSIKVGGDPHLTATYRYLYILSQSDSSINEYKFYNLKPTGRSGTMPNVHGVTPGTNRNLFITDISGRKIGSYKIPTQTTKAITNVGSTKGVAHNLAYNPDKKILALTLSGSNTVDFFKANGKKIKYLSTDESGMNPFGITYIDR